jgi:hypothetical protein
MRLYIVSMPCFRDAHLPQLYGISYNNSTPLFIALHDIIRTDLKSFVTPYIRSGQLLHVAAVATRVAEHLRVCGSLASFPRPSTQHPRAGWSLHVSEHWEVARNLRPS